MSAAPPRRRSRVPRSALERVSRVGVLAGELALGGVLEQARRLVGRRENAAWSALLTPANGRRLAERLAHLRGAAMKLGQLLSLEGDEFLPPEFAEAIAALRADGDAMPETQLLRVLEKEWKREWRTRVASFDLEPVAAASIGQVHRATALDGAALAVKIQFPGVADSIDSDIDALVRALRWSQLLPRDVDLAALATEAKRQLHREADYRLEAKHLARYAELLADEPRLAVPRPRPELTTRRVLAMEYLPGAPLEELCAPEQPQAARDAVGTALYRLLLREVFSLRFVQSDPNFANYLWLSESQRLGLIDLGAAHPVSKRLADGYALLLRSAMRGDREGMRHFATSLGFVADGDGERRLEAVVDLLEASCEPFAARGVYDFGRSSLAERLRNAALSLAFDAGHRRPPPPETLFLQRKFAGTFLLCARLRARIPLRNLAEAALGA
ncbi:MAG: AarF/ABC1/UbiB kinase family protein [Deltaproteobacteria bacterium]|nr:AarF/ABC1/UbiB kinase family protein [Deltaproteobacteria bacterium]